MSRFGFIIAVIIFWLLFSFGGSLVHSENCDKVFPIDYIFYNKLFCEVKK